MKKKPETKFHLFLDGRADGPYTLNQIRGFISASGVEALAGSGSVVTAQTLASDNCGQHWLPVETFLNPRPVIKTRILNHPPGNPYTWWMLACPVLAFFAVGMAGHDDKISPGAGGMFNAFAAMMTPAFFFFWLLYELRGIQVAIRNRPSDS